MIGSSLGWLFEAGAEHAAVKAILGFVKNLWAGTGSEAVSEWVKTKFVPKGLDDESVFGYILSVAKYKNGDPKGNKLRKVDDSKINLIRGTYADLAQEDTDNNTHYASNARIIIVMDAVGRGFITTEKKDKDGKVVGVKKEPDPNHVLPGVAIIQDIAINCRTKAEIRNYLLALGAFQDAPFGTLDELRHWAKTVGWPALVEKLDQVQDQLRQGADNTATAVRNYYEDMDNQWDQAVSMPWTNPLTKIIALLRAM